MDTLQASAARDLAPELLGPGYAYGPRGDVVGLDEDLDEAAASDAVPDPDARVLYLPGGTEPFAVRGTATELQDWHRRVGGVLAAGYTVIGSRDVDGTLTVAGVLEGEHLTVDGGPGPEHASRYAEFFPTADPDDAEAQARAHCAGAP